LKIRWIHSERHCLFSLHTFRHIFLGFPVLSERKTKLCVRFVS